MQNDEGWLTHLFAGVESQSEIPSANHLHHKGKAKAVIVLSIRNRDIHVDIGRAVDKPAATAIASVMGA